ncbi:hypothetical protein EC968_010591 [Mortierella alpina]|nr:hypothetical protein EC968_010591 [Mortierella alpina]
MGVAGAFPFISQRGYIAESVAPNNVPGQKHVDVLALFYAYIACRVKTMLGAQFRKEYRESHTVNSSPSSQPSNLSVENLKKLAKELDLKLRSVLNPDACILHMDGQYTQEKAGQHDKRRERKADEEAVALRLIAKAESRSSRASEKDTALSSDRTKIVALAKSATSQWKSLRVVHAYVRSGLTLELQLLGWTIHQCPGECDTCIMKNQTEGETLVVVSTDSDYLFRGNGDLILLRQNTKRRQRYTCYNCKDILDHVGMTWGAWKALAITTTNDYSRSKWGDCPSNVYSAYVGEVLTRYKDALAIFCMNEETLLEETPVTPDRVDDHYRSMIFTVGRQLSSYMRYMPGIKYNTRPFPRPGAPTQTNPNHSEDGAEDEHQEQDQDQDQDEDEETDDDVSDDDEDDNEEEEEEDLEIQTSAQVATTLQPSESTHQSKKPKGNVAPRRDPKLRQRAATIIDKALAFRYAQVSLDFGTLKRHVDDSLKVFKTLDDSTAALSEADQAVVSREVLATIKSMVQLKTALTRHGQDALFLYASSVMRQFPTLSTADVATRRNRLHFLAGTERTFYTTVLTDLQNWKQYEPSSSSAITAKACSRLVVEEYQTQFTTNPLADLKNNLATGVSGFIDQTASHLQSQIITHLRTSIPKLITKIKVENYEWSCGTGCELLTAIADASGYKDQFTHIPEAVLMQAVLRKRPEDKETRNALVPAFGSSTMAQAHAHLFPGDITRRLFCGVKSSYGKGLGSVSPYAPKCVVDLQGREREQFLAKAKAVDNATTIDDAYIRTLREFEDLVKEGLKSPAEYKAMSPTRLDGKPFRSKKFKSGLPILHQVGYMTTRLPTRDHIHEVFENRDVVVAAIDPGICKTAAVSIVNSATPTSAQRFTIPRTANTTATKRFMKEMETQKALHRIQELEGTILPLKFEQQLNNEQYWTAFKKTVEDHNKSSSRVEVSLRTFYGSEKFKAMTWDRKRAAKAEVTRGIDRLIDIVKSPPDSTPFIAMGDGKFGIKRGPTFTDKFAKTLYTRSQGAGVRMHYVSEFKTSMLCCQCKSKTVKKGRQVLCKIGCQGAKRDRDDNASQNMANLTHHYVDNLEWPTEFQRPARLPAAN